MKKPFCIVALACCAAVLASAVAGATEPVALVLATSGTSVPAMAPYTEITAGERITLPKGASVTFLHYQTCTRVSIDNGSVTVGADSYQLGVGAHETELRVQCPTRLVVDRGMQTATLVVRGLNPRVPIQPGAAVVLLGARSGAFRTVRILQGQTLIREALITGPNFRWPGAAVGLSPNSAYRLELMRNDSTKPPVEIDLVVAPASSDPPDVLVSLP